MVNSKFWKDKKVLVTGHTGFKGSWLSIILAYLKADVVGISLNPNSENNLYDCANLKNIIKSVILDINDYEKLHKTIKKEQPEIIIHMAAQALVIDSYHNPLQTYRTNIIGTANILNIGREIDSVKTILNVTSDKCYENTETKKPYSEFDRMGGHDPYSSSKGCSELITASYLQSYYSKLNKGLASARAGNVIGGGDWSENRLIPDIFRSIENSTTLNIRYPNSIRPWQHVLDPLFGYIRLVELLYSNPLKYSSGWNFGPEESNNMTVAQVIDLLLNKLDIESHYNHGHEENFHEASLLMLDISKSKDLLGWHPKWDINKSIDNIASWYQAYKNKEDIFKLCEKQIEEYIRHD